MGSGGKGGSQANAAATAQADIAKSLFAETGPLRSLLFGGPGTPGTPGMPAVAGMPSVAPITPFAEESTADFLRRGGSLETVFGGGSPGRAAVPGSAATLGTPGLLQNLLTQPAGIFPAERDMLESQFGRARENIISSGPARGGLQASLLAQNEAERAFGLTGLASMGQQRQIENIFRTAGVTTGQNQLSLGGLGSAGGIFSGLAGQQAAMAGQLGQAAGLTAGLGMAGKGAGAAGKAAVPTQVALAGGGAFCWIARAIYGDSSIEAELAQRWIADEWRGPVAILSRFLYRTFGQRVATWPWALRLLRPWFDVAVQKARR